MSDPVVTTPSLLESQEKYKEYLMQGLLPLLPVQDLLNAAQNSLNTAGVNNKYMDVEEAFQQFTLEEESHVRDSQLNWLDWHTWGINEAGFRTLKAEWNQLMGLNPTNDFFSGMLFVYMKDGKLCPPNTPGAHFLEISGNSSDGYRVVDWTVLRPNGGSIDASDIPAEPGKDPTAFGFNEQWLCYHEKNFTSRDGDGGLKDTMETQAEINKHQDEFSDVLNTQMRSSTQNSDSLITGLNQNCNDMNNVVSIASALCHIASALTRAGMRK